MIRVAIVKRQAALRRALWRAARADDYRRWQCIAERLGLFPWGVAP